MRKMMGMGIMTAAIQPRRVDAHCTPMFPNICVVKSGKEAPTRDRSIMFAANAEAALYVPVSKSIYDGVNGQSGCLQFAIGV